MIKELKIENFKCFSDRTTIPLSNLTVCTGMNSVGKSTLIQALLLIRQSYENILKSQCPEDGIKILLNTDSLNLGSTKQIMLTDHMILSVDNIWFKYSAGDDKLSLNLNETNIDLRDGIKTATLFNSELYYLNAERLGPRNYQEMKSHDVLHCGYHGEFTFDVIEKNPMAEISECRRFNIEGEKRIPELTKQIGYWMSYVVNGVEVNFSSDLTTQLSQMKVRQSALDTPFNSPYNFGFGISYVLPIIATGLIANTNAIIIVENPEAHLHPAGQSRIGEFLAQVSSDGIQVIVETHSEHVINGIRKFALRNRIPPEEICINYFTINRNTQKHETSRLPLNERMDILIWPEGFFDQEEKDLKEMRILRGYLK